MRAPRLIAFSCAALAFLGAAQGDDTSRSLPLNPYENAKAGDWVSFVGESSQGGVVLPLDRITWTVKKVKTDELILTMTNHGGAGSSDEQFFDPRKTPTVEAYLNLTPSTSGSTISDVKVEDATRTVSDRTFACKKYSCVLRHEGQTDRVTLWLCPAVKGGALVEMSIDYEGATAIQMRLHVAGFGNGDKVEWGTKGTDIDLAKFVPTLVSTEEQIPEDRAVAKAQEYLAAARSSIEAIRGVKVDFEVPVKLSKKEIAKRFLAREAASRFPVSTTAAGLAALSRFKVLRENRDWNTWVLSYFWGYAYYDPTEKTIFVGGPVPAALLRMHVFRELVFAIQDRRFDLQKYGQAASEDAALARRFATHGEASLLIKLDEARARGKSELVSDLIDAEVANIPHEVDGARKNGDDTLPYYSLRSSLEPISRGAAVVLAVKKAGGWKAVDGLFEKPPGSTAQMLHPQKLLGKREEPVAIVLPDLDSQLGTGWKRILRTTLGELAIQCALDERDRRKESASATATWKGDLLDVYEGDNAQTFVWLTTWGTVEGAKEFAKTWQATLDDGKGVEGASIVSRNGSDVVVVEGAPADTSPAVLADAALKGAKKTK